VRQAALAAVGLSVAHVFREGSGAVDAVHVVVL
jgi:hypothetical protein